jgi:hypothetical protein
MTVAGQSGDFHDLTKPARMQALSDTTSEGIQVLSLQRAFPHKILALLALLACRSRQGQGLVKNSPPLLPKRQRHACSLAL